MFPALIVVLLLASTGMGQCPKKCHCSKYKTFCRLSKLYNLPSGLPISTELLKMKLDHIVELNNSMVSNSGLSSLKYLVITGVGLQEIQPGSFQTMNLLQSITITGNNITVLKPNTFKFLDNLYFLNLSYNNIRHLNSESFSGVANIRHLDLSRNRIKFLDANIFQDMRNSSKCGVITTKAKLDLSGNQIKFVDFGVFQYLCLFTHLNLNSLDYDYFNAASYMSSKNLTNGAFLGLTRATKLQINNITFNKLSNIFNGLSGLLQLKITRGNIQEIETGVFENLKVLKHLDLSINRISKIKSDTFKGLNSLKVFKLDDNNISTLNNDVFHHLKSLETLSMVWCAISIIEPGAFNGLIQLQNLNLQNNNIVTLRNNIFSNLTMLRELNLNFNFIKIIQTGAFKGLNQLQNLNLQHNDINILRNNTFSNLTMLRELTFNVNHIKIIETGAFCDLNQLQNLNLENNDIDILRNNTFSNLTMLRELNLNFNRIKIIETGAFAEPWTIKTFSHYVLDGMEDMTYVKLNYRITKQEIGLILEIHAPLSNTKLTVLLESIQGIEMLKYMHLQMNATSMILHKQLSDILYNVHNVTQLGLLLVDMNSTETLAAFSTFKLSKLRIIESNSLVFKSNSFISLPELEDLEILQCNDLEIQRNALQQLNSLTTVTFMYNKHIKIESGSFMGLHTLKYLDISYNQINELLNGSFLGLNNLENLYFNYNNLNTVKIGSFQDLVNINTIRLNNNNLKQITAGVFGAVCEIDFVLSCRNGSASSPYCNATNALKTLQHLDLSHNGIQHIHPHAFIGCSNLHSLDVSYNKLLTLHNSFLFTPALTTLYMFGCNISYIPDNSFECSPLITDIKLRIYSTLFNVTPLLILRQLKFTHIHFDTIPIDCAFYETWYWLLERHISFVINDNSMFYDSSRITDNKIESDLSSLTCNTTLQYDGARNTSTFTNDFVFFKQYIEPIVLVIILISGLASNGFLLFISLRHSDMRTKQNACIIHLAAVDLLSLVLNLSLSYWDVLHVTWELGDTMCKIFILAKDMMMGASVLSIVALSLERYLVARTFNSLKNICDVSEHVPTAWFILMTWISSIVLSLPAYYSATVDIRCLYCPPGNEDYIKRVWTFQFIVYCLLPTVVITFLNVNTFISMKTSISKMPGEVKNAYLTKNRTMIANMVLILAVVFFICYMPNFILRLLIAWSVFDIENVFLISFFSFCLFFCNTICNPISLFIMSQKFKTRALKCFPCLRDQQNDKHNIRIFTTLTARNTKQPEKGNLMRLLGCFTGICNNGISKNAQVVGSTVELELQQHEVESSPSSYNTAVQARMERLAKLQERFTGISNKPTMPVPKTEIQVQESNIQTGVSPDEREEFVKSVQAARMERLAKLQERFTGRSNRSQL